MGNRASAQAENDDALVVAVLGLNAETLDRSFIGRLHGQLSEFTSQVRFVETTKGRTNLRRQVGQAKEVIAQRSASAVAWIYLNGGRKRGHRFETARLLILLADRGQGLGERLVITELSPDSTRSSMLEEAAIVTREMLLAWRRTEPVGAPPDEALEAAESLDASNAAATDADASDRADSEATDTASDLEDPPVEPTPDVSAPSPLEIVGGVGVQHHIDGKSELGTGGIWALLGLGLPPFRLALVGKLGLWGGFSDPYADLRTRAHRVAIRGEIELAQHAGSSIGAGLQMGVCIDSIEPTARVAAVSNVRDANLVAYCAGIDALGRLALSEHLALELALGLAVQPQTQKTRYEADFDAPRHEQWNLRPYGTLGISYSFEAW